MREKREVAIMSDEEFQYWKKRQRSLIKYCDRCGHAYKIPGLRSRKSKYCPSCLKKSNERGYKMVPQLDKTIDNFSERLQHFVDIGVLEGWYENEQLIIPVVTKFSGDICNIRNILAFCDKNGIYIISDDNYNTFIFYGKAKLKKYQDGIKYLHSLREYVFSGLTSYDRSFYFFKRGNDMFILHYDDKTVFCDYVEFIEKEFLKGKSICLETKKNR